MASFYSGLPKFEVKDGGTGGPVEAVKTGVINALRTVFQDSAFSDDADKNTDTVHVDMEYPVAKVDYPGIWVQFSFSKLEPSGMAHMTEADGSLIRQWNYEGRVTLLVVALSSIKRDKIADRLITELAFAARDQVQGVSKPSTFLDEIQSYPYISIMLNTDAIVPGGQSITVGAPWKEDELVYEDSYSFSIMGEFQQIQDASGAVVLRRVDIIPELVNDLDHSSGLGTWF